MEWSKGGMVRWLNGGMDRGMAEWSEIVAENIWGQKKTYSSSNAAARDPEERVFYNF